jgi:CheY-like chemotaxis protein
MEPLKKVFCVEDNKQIAILLHYQLEKLGYQLCGVADNAPDAVTGIWMSRPDIVLVDIELNGKLEGFEVGNFLVSKTDIPFVYITGHDNPEILETARRTTLNGYLTKPFSHHDLKAALDMAQKKGKE